MAERVHASVLAGRASISEIVQGLEAYAQIRVREALEDEPLPYIELWQVGDEWQWSTRIAKDEYLSGRAKQPHDAATAAIRALIPKETAMPTDPQERERYDLWRAIDLLVQETGSRGDTSQWFRQEWEKLVNERNGTRDG